MVSRSESGTVCSTAQPLTQLIIPLSFPLQPLFFLRSPPLTLFVVGTSSPLSPSLALELTRGAKDSSRPEPVSVSLKVIHQSVCRLSMSRILLLRHRATPAAADGHTLAQRSGMHECLCVCVCVSAFLLERLDVRLVILLSVDGER